MRRRIASLGLVPLLLLPLASCGSGADTPDAAESSDASLTGVSVSGKLGQQPHVQIKAPLSLDATHAQTVITGHGSPVVEGKQALLNLYVADGRTGKKAAATYDQGAPVALKMTQDSIFPSVLHAIVGKPAGSRVVVAATPEDGYGDAGAKQIGIKPQDDVVFVVDIMSVTPTKVLHGPTGKALDPPEDTPAVQEKHGTVTGLDFSHAAKPPGKLQVIPLRQGTGPKARDDSLVTFDYLGQVYGSDQVFDESFSKAPVTFPLGVGGLIPAWDQGLVGLRRGARVLIIAPPESGYGKQGNPSAGIKGTDTLAFVVDVLGVS